MGALYQLMRFMRLRFTRLWLNLHRLLLILKLFGLVAVSHAAAATDVLPDEVALQSTLQAALQQAEELQLSEHEVWLALLHYKRETVLRRFVSQADDDRFFLAENGSTDAHAELMANIRAFMRRAEAGHAQCLFPARWWWLKQQLNLSDEYDVRCPKLDAFMDRVSNDRLFMVFPSMYLNNPGSTFGHTFLRFDDNDDSILLSQTLNYAARVDQNDDIVSYVSKGLFGGYKGLFRARPYFETVQEYSNIENRNIWEYQLDFTRDEIAQLVRHVWEVKGIDFDYYFFRENCSYRLLALLDVMRPEIQLTREENFPVYAIPVDTVRVLDDADIIRSRKFRASLATQIDDYFSLTEDEISAIVLEIVAEDTPADKQVISDSLKDLASQEDKLNVLKQSYNILQFSNQSSSPKAQKILQLTNQISHRITAPKQAVNSLHEVSPETGHESIRVAAGYGEQNNLQYVELKLRPAFHDLLDAPQGYVDGAAINVFDARFKWFINNNSVNNNFPGNNTSGKLRLESLSLFNVTSLSPISRWQTPVSWMLDFRFDRTQMSETDSVRNFISRGGLGFSIKRQAVMPFVLLMGEWNISSSYDKGHSLLLGLQAGVQLSVSANQLMVSYEIDDAVSGFDLDRSITQAQWQYNLQVNHALRVSYKRIEYDFFDDEDWSFSYNYYF